MLLNFFLSLSNQGTRTRELLFTLELVKVEVDSSLTCRRSVQKKDLKAWRKPDYSKKMILILKLLSLKRIYIYILEILIMFQLFYWTAPRSDQKHLNIIYFGFFFQFCEPASCFEINLILVLLLKDKMVYFLFKYQYYLWI